MFSKPVQVFLIIASYALFSGADGPYPMRTIPFTKRTGMTRDDGVFDAFRAHRSVIATKNKHRQNMINRERNVKAAISEISPIDGVHASIAGGGKEGSEALSDIGQDTEWVGFITLGSSTPPQRFDIDFDTGSSDIWVYSSACVTRNVCNGKRQYDSTASKTSHKESGTFRIRYGSGAIYSGDIFTDTIDVAGIKVEKQYFAAATNASPSFAQDPADGIFGLAFPEISRLNQNPFFQNAIEKGAVANHVFAFFLSNTSAAELHLGGVNHSVFTGSIEYHSPPLSSILSPSGFWVIPNGRVDVNEKQRVVSGFETIIDSGTTLMYGPPGDVQKVYAKVPGAGPITDNPQLDGFYQFPCSAITVPKISFGWGGKQWEVSGWDFNLGMTFPGSTDCVGALVGQDIGLGNRWLLGDSFMKNVYTVFDVDKRSVGFAQLSKR